MLLIKRLFNFDKREKKIPRHLHKDGQDLKKLTEIGDEFRDNLQSLEDYGQDVTDEAEHIICSEQDIVHVLE